MATVSLLFATVSSATDPQPDPAPTMPVQPDPAPGGTPAPVPAQPVVPRSGAQPTPIPDDEPAPAQSTAVSTPPRDSASAARKRAAKARARRLAERRRRHRSIEAAAARRTTAAADEATAWRKAVSAEPAAPRLGPSGHLGPLVPSAKSADETHSRILLGAAGALLALVLASGSLLALGARVTNEQTE